MSEEIINSIKTPGNGITSRLNYNGTKTRMEFNGNCSNQDKITYTQGKIVNIYIVYELTGSNFDNNGSAVKSSLFGAVRLTKNADIDKYQYSGYGTGFDRRANFSFLVGGFGSNVMIFEVDIISSVHVGNKKRHFNSWKSPKQGLEHTLATAKIYSINFTVTKNKSCLSRRDNRANSYLFVNGTEIHKFKAKDCRNSIMFRKHFKRLVSR